MDASLAFVGRIRTPWPSRSDCPRRGSLEGPLCRIEVFDPWVPALLGVAIGARIEVFYWLHLSRRDLVQQNPHSRGRICGTFSLRSPVRPNPIGTSIAVVTGLEGSTLLVRGLDCVDGTPLLDVRPARCPLASGPDREES